MCCHDHICCPFQIIIRLLLDTWALVTTPSTIVLNFFDGIGWMFEGKNIFKRKKLSNLMYAQGDSGDLGDRKNTNENLS